MSTLCNHIIRLHPADNVVVAREQIEGNVSIHAEGCVTRISIQPGHKIATSLIPAGKPVRKYNQLIGFASEDIQAGEHVHSHNLEFKNFARSHDIGSGTKVTELIPEAERASFQGYLRDNGRVATRNYIGVISTVNCSATVVRYIADSFNRAGTMDAYPNVDDVVALTHGTGCGIAANGEGHQNLQRVLSGYACHPNFAGVLLIGLGCEVNQLTTLMEASGLEPGPLMQMMTIQETGGTRQSIEKGVSLIEAMLPVANQASRQTCSASELTLALQCGGSDGYSGIGANPALGAAVDLLVQHGGTAILSETPEIYGAEHLLLRRAVSREVGEKLLEKIRWWETYTERNNARMDNNPAPGNKAGGLTTILEKALGSSAKGGTTNLVDVYQYAEPVTARGLVFMDSPGYDPASVTGQVASGANLVCFTTGRGSVFGFKPSPTIKIATNTAMFERMHDDMDVNAGAIIDGSADINEIGQKIFATLLKVASGGASKSESLGFGDNEFVPWQIGAVM